jgi:protein-L-isoaspartate(D-aspartate) O-methyltransferase
MSDFATARQNMVDCQVRPSDVTDNRIIDAMLAIPREIFVPEDRRALAYLDLDLVVSSPNTPKRVLIKPAVIAKLLQAAEIGETDSVLVVGSASGYTAAIAAKLAQRVVATDPDADLVGRANAAFGQLGLATATAKLAKPADGDAQDGPYDVIVLEGATAIVPETLYRQLKDGGRLAGVFLDGRVQRATIVTRSRDDFGSRILFDASAPVLPGLEQTPEFAF